MRGYKSRLTLYQIAAKGRLILYLAAALVVFIPILIVTFTDNPFNPIYSKVYISSALTFIILGKVLTAYKKTIENRTLPWATIGTITGFLIVLIWGVLR